MSSTKFASLGMLGVPAALQTACMPQAQEEWIVPETDRLACDAWAEVPRQNAIYFNNVWNMQAAGNFPWIQCIVQDPKDSQRLGFYWRWPSSGRDVFAQPQVKIGMSPWAPVPRSDDRFPVQLKTIDAMDVITQVAIGGPSEFNIVTTLWLTDSPTILTEAKPDSIVAEIMIWTYATGGHLSPAGRKIGSTQHDGAGWDIWLDENWHDVSGVNDNRWIYVAFVAKESGLSANFDPTALLRSRPLEKLGLADAYIADVELGAEVMQGEGLLWIDHFEVSISTK